MTFEEYDRYCDAMERERPEDEGWGRGSRPVINVSWEDARAFVAWLNSETGDDAEGPYRLPSEAEWEYACRGDQSGKNATSFSPSVGASSSPTGAFLTSEEANFDGNFTYNGSPRGEYRQKTVAVDHEDFPTNAFGLRQMHGNVQEWCEDHFEDDYGRVPSFGSAYETDDGSLRVLRGGSWINSPRDLRSAFRSWGQPALGDSSIGFRLCRTLTS